MSFGKMWNIFVDELINGSYVNILIGLRNTLIIAILGLFIGIIIGTLIAAIKVAENRNTIAKVFARIGDIYTALFRGTPIVVQLLVFHYIVFPVLGINLNAVIEAVLVFGMNSSAYVAEIMRGGILSVDNGQYEAGRTLGMGYTSTMVRIVFPQAIKNVLPTLGNELIMLLKDTSVASFITVVDLTKAFTLIPGKTYEYMVPYLMLAVCYLILVLLATVLIRFVERRLRKSERKR